MLDRPLADPASPLRVLLVEQDAAIAEMYRFQLEADGFAVAIAPTADAALASIALSAPDIILLDMLLPKGGLELLQNLRHTVGSKLPVVFLSNIVDAEFIKSGLELGAVDYLILSRTTPNEVSQRIRGWIGASGGRLA